MLYMTRESYQTRYVSMKCYYYYCIFACLKFDLIFEGMLYVYIGFLCICAPHQDADKGCDCFCYVSTAGRGF